jgi:hypothetical protein
LGPDQKYDILTLREGLHKKGLNNIEIRRLDVYNNKYRLHSSSLIKNEIIKRYQKNIK